VFKRRGSHLCNNLTNIYVEPCSYLDFVAVSAYMHLVANGGRTLTAFSDSVKRAIHIELKHIPVRLFRRLCSSVSVQRPTVTFLLPFCIIQKRGRIFSNLTDFLLVPVTETKTEATASTIVNYILQTISMNI